MSTISIKESTQKAKLHLIDVLNNNIAGELNSTSDYPLPDPEIWIESRLQQDWARPFRDLNVEEVAGVVAGWQPTEGIGDKTGDSTQYERAQELQFVCQVAIREPGGFDLPDIRGRQSHITEWLSRRAEKYKGGLMTALSKNAIDGQKVRNFDIVVHDAETTPPTEVGPIGLASVVVSLSQDVLVPLS
ncbi:MAG: hypothetical protein ABEN55_16250 [Bradymonadaceae bacterium]